jgi:hypothetical protein
MTATIETTRSKPGDGSTHCCRKLAASLGISKDAVHRVWKEAGLKPYLLHVRFSLIENEERMTQALRGIRQMFHKG